MCLVITQVSPKPRVDTSYKALVLHSLQGIAKPMIMGNKAARATTLLGLVLSLLGNATAQLDITPEPVDPEDPSVLSDYATAPAPTPAPPDEECILPLQYLEESLEQFSDLLTAVQAAGLQDQLLQPNANQTILAPTNEAFATAVDRLSLTRDELFGTRSK